jgi:hypothetical protein
MFISQEDLRIKIMLLSTKSVISHNATLNHDKPGQPVGFALVGPFLRADAPFRERGAADMMIAPHGAHLPMPPAWLSSCSVSLLL